MEMNCVSRSQFKFCVVWLSLALSALSPSLSESKDRHPEPRLGLADRMAGLGKAWGTAKFFHPRLARANLDWDKALVQAIPEVAAAGDDTEYVFALNKMLSRLGDPNTNATIQTADDNRDDYVESSHELATLAGSRLVLQPSQLGLSDASASMPDAQLKFAILKLLPQATSILIDLSHVPTGEANPQLKKVLALIVSQQVFLPSKHERSYNGFPPQRGDSSGEFFASELVSRASVILGAGTAPLPPIEVRVDSTSSPYFDVIFGLWSIGARISGPIPTPFGDVQEVRLVPGIVLRISTSEFSIARAAVLDNASSSPLRTDSAALATLRAIASDQDEPPAAWADLGYPEMSPPNPEFRLLALFRYWNVVQYFYPYKNLIGRDWEDVLKEYVPLFLSSDTEITYETAVRRLSTELHDSHAFLGPTKALYEFVGGFLPPISLRAVSGHSIVVASFDTSVPIWIGDEVVSIDRESTSSRTMYFQTLHPASTPQAAAMIAQPYLLRGSQNSTVRLEVRSPSGQVRTVSLQRTLPSNDARLLNAFKRKTQIASVLEGNIGYLDLDRAEPADLDEMFRTVANTSGLILDMRGYPNGTTWDIAGRLGARSNPVAAVFLQPYVQGSTIGSIKSTHPMFRAEQRIESSTGPRYLGPVVVLIDETTVSQGEHACLLFEAATDVTFIGSPTSGTNGDVTNFLLPGSITASMSGDAVLHADGSQLQRVGIVPDVHAPLSVEGVASGTDEVLEVALRYLAKSKLSSINRNRELTPRPH
jgi:C-terminal processing protease CtpA/Prc